MTTDSDLELGVTIDHLSEYINKYTRYRVNRLVNEFEPLNGQAPDDYLATRAVADEKNQRSRTYLAILKRTGAVIGYFTLAVGSLVVPDDNRMSPSMKSMIRVDSGIAQSFLLEHVSRSKGTPKGFGSDLVDVAIAHVLQANAEVGCAMLRLECEEGLVDYYAEKGFALISERKDGMNSMMLLLSPPEPSSEPASPRRHETLLQTEGRVPYPLSYASRDCPTGSFSMKRACTNPTLSTVFAIVGHKAVCLPFSFLVTARKRSALGLSKSPWSVLIPGRRFI